jgi:HK97 gp10 family phage protein
MGYKSNAKNVTNAIEDWENNALEAIGMFVVGEATMRCPSDTGNLRSSIRHVVNKSNKSVVIGTNVEYAVYVEKGTGIYAKDGNGRQTPWFYVDDKGEGHFTHGSKPQPYLTPAAEDNINKIKEIARQVKFAHGAE